MHKIKKLIAFTLILSLLVTIIPLNPVNVYAAGDEYVIGGSTGNSKYQLVKSKNSWSSTRQWIRVSIVDKNGNNVLLEQGKGFGGIDILYFYPGIYNNDKNQYNKFGEYGTNENYRMYTWDDIKDMLKESVENNPYMGI